MGAIALAQATSDVAYCDLIKNFRAVTLTDAPSSYTFTEQNFSGNAVDIRNDANAAATVNVSGAGGAPSVVENPQSATTTINATLSITVTPLANGSEVRVYETGTSTEVDGIESSTGGEFTFSVDSGVAVDIVVLNYDPPKIPIRIENKTFTVNQDLDPFQRDDPNFSDP
jgi:hypothetical protein